MNTVINMLMKYLSMAALKVVKMTTSSVASVKTSVKIMTFPFQYFDNKWFSVKEIMMQTITHTPSPPRHNKNLRSNHWKTRTTRAPAFWGYPSLPHDYPYYWVILDPKSKEDKVKVTNLKNLPKFHFFKFWNKLYTRHTFWSCLIRCANMKWIRRVLLKLQSGHNSVHRQTDGRTDGLIAWNQYTPPFNFIEVGKKKT